MAVDQVVEARDVGTVVADVAKERAQGTLVVETERQRAELTRGRLQLDGHVHGDAKLGVRGTGERVRLDDVGAALVGEEVDGVRGVMPEEVVGPTPRLAERVQVGAAKEVRLHVHLEDPKFAGANALVDPLM